MFKPSLNSGPRIVIEISRVLVVLLAFNSIVAAQQSTTWNFYRGEHYTGRALESGIVDEWPSRGPPIFWSRDLGVGYSGFVGNSKRIFTQYQSLTGQYVVCLNAQDGTTIWEHRYAWPFEPASLYPGPRSTPTVSGDRVFFTSPRAELGCLNASTGAPIWSVNLAQTFDAEPVEFGYSCSPVCVDGKVILPVGGKDASMVALAESDGSVVWQSGNEPISYCSAYPIEFAQRKLVVGYFKNSLCVFDRNNGSELGKLAVSDGYDEHSAWPIYREPYLWISGPFRAGSHLLELVADGERIRMTTVYKTNDMSNDVASSVLLDGKLYGFDLRDVQSKVHRPSRGQFTCMDFLSGEVHWKNGTSGRRRMDEGVTSSSSQKSASDVGHASVIEADEKLILLNDIGELILGRQDPDKFVELGRARILGGEICWTQPTLINRCVYARNHSKAICVYVGDVSELGRNEDQLRFATEFHQPEYFDLAAIVLGTEPKYAMTSPNLNWLTRWYVISLIGGWMVVPVFVFSIARLSGIRNARWLFLGLTFCFGAIGTSVFGHWLHVFYFSWPIALAIAFEELVCQLKGKERSSLGRAWMVRLYLLAFVGLCLAYFWFCRRLSLAFEWSFLMGFPVSLPVLWLLKQRVQSENRFTLIQWLLSAAAFTAFYWAGAGIILWKY